jgi:hypothetical protein
VRLGWVLRTAALASILLMGSRGDWRQEILDTVRNAKPTLYTWSKPRRFGVGFVDPDVARQHLDRKPD